MKYKPVKYKPGPVDVVFDIFIYVFFIAFTVMCVFPIYYIFINTISDNELVAQGRILFLPRGFHLENYVKVMRLSALPQALLVSVSRTVIGTSLSVICTAFVAYVLTKKTLCHRKLVYRFFIVTMYFNAGLIPVYLTMRNLHLYNNFFVYIIGVISVFNVILVKTYIESIPESIEESAAIDGAGYLVIFTRLILPLTVPILATIAVFNAVGHWNSFMDTLLYIRNPKLFTLQFLLWQYLNQANNLAATLRQAVITGDSGFNPATVMTPTSVRMTITIVVTLPVLFVYPFFQKYFVKGIMIGAIKG
ncbi:MAG: carbohydrate ABC transporter permease [Treponema sp.]|jgi:multiple sugar transport system permease protein/putative aldouronate transport system permease protein|nr:carbohydrate ABC transporter permease [Treponema sp.]